MHITMLDIWNSCRQSLYWLTTTTTDDGHHLCWICSYIMSQEAVKVICMGLKGHYIIWGMDLIILTSVSFSLCCSWEFCQLQGKSMSQTCWLWSHQCIFGWDLCLCSHTKKKGLIILLYGKKKKKQQKKKKLLWIWMIPSIPPHPMHICVSWHFFFFFHFNAKIIILSFAIQNH